VPSIAFKSFWMSSPEYNFKSYIRVSLDEDQKYSVFVTRRMTEINKFNVMGYIPGFGSFSGFVRLILAISDLYRLSQWTPSEKELDAAFHLDKREVSQKSAPTVHKLGGVKNGDQKAARLAALDRKTTPATVLEESRLPDASDNDTVRGACLQIGKDDIERIVQKAKAEWKTTILMNMGRALLEIVPCGGVIAVVNDIVLYANQEGKIRDDLKEHPITFDQVLADTQKPEKASTPEPDEKRIKTTADLDTRADDMLAKEDQAFVKRSEWLLRKPPKNTTVRYLDTRRSRIIELTMLERIWMQEFDRD
jgi:hypothetical protein